MKLRVGAAGVLAFAMAVQATSALAQTDPRRDDARYSSDRRDDPRDRDDARYRDDGRYPDDRYGDRGPYPYTYRAYDEPQPERYCGNHKGRRAPAIMTYDGRTGTQVLVDNNPGGVAVTGRNDETGSAFGVKGDLSEPGVPYMCAADEQSGDAYVIEPRNGGYDADVRGIDADTGRRWAVTGAEAGPEFETYDPDTGCVARLEPRENGRPVVVSGVNYDDDYRSFNDDFFGAGAVVLGAAAVGAAASGNGPAAAALGAAAVGSAAAGSGPSC